MTNSEAKVAVSAMMLIVIAVMGFLMMMGVGDVNAQGLDLKNAKYVKKTYLGGLYIGSTKDASTPVSHAIEELGGVEAEFPVLSGVINARAIWAADKQFGLFYYKKEWAVNRAGIQLGNQPRPITLIGPNPISPEANFKSLAEKQIPGGAIGALANIRIGDDVGYIGLYADGGKSELNLGYVANFTGTALKKFSAGIRSSQTKFDVAAKFAFSRLEVTAFHGLESDYSGGVLKNTSSLYINTEPSTDVGIYLDLVHRSFNEELAAEQQKSGWERIEIGVTKRFSEDNLSIAGFTPNFLLGAAYCYSQTPTQSNMAKVYLQFWIN